MKILTEAQIDKSIASVERRAKTLQEDIHKCAVSICHHWRAQTAPKSIKPENAAAAAKTALERLERLSKASPYHGQAFATWMAHFLPVRHEGDEWALNAVKLGSKEFEAARDTPFYELVKPKAAKPLDAVEAARALLGKARKAQGKDGANVPDGFCEAMARIIAEYDQPEH